MACENSFMSYAQKKIDDIQFLNVQDICLCIAIDFHSEGNIPECAFSKIQLDKIEKEHMEYLNTKFDKVEFEEYKENFEYDAFFIVKLRPIQEWLVKEVCKAIKKNELKPKVLGLYMDGEIDPTKTYVSDYKITKWLGYRGIEASIYSGKGEVMDAFISCSIKLAETIYFEHELISDRVNSRGVYSNIETKVGFDTTFDEHFSSNDEICMLEAQIHKLKYETKKWYGKVCAF